MDTNRIHIGNLTWVESDERDDCVLVIRKGGGAEELKSSIAEREPDIELGVVRLCAPLPLLLPLASALSLWVRGRSA